jgi:hypothetical protein
MRLPVILALLATSTVAWAGKVEVKNDTFDIEKMTMLNFAGDAGKGEAVAETFTKDKLARYYPFKITGMQFMAGPGGMTRMEFVVYEDTGGVNPGRELIRYKPTDVLEGSTMFLQDVEFPIQPAVSDRNIGVRVAIFPETPSAMSKVNYALDPMAPTSDNSKVYAEFPPGTYRWYTLPAFAAMLGVRLQGVWVIRLVIETDAVPNTGDMRRPDGGGGGGGDGGGMLPGDPVVQSITPDTVIEGMGGAAVILGLNFRAQAPGSSVLFDGPKGPQVLRNVSVMDERSIKVAIPVDLPLGDYDVVVKNEESGRSGTLPKGFHVVAKGCACDLSAAGGGGAPAGALLFLGLCALVLRRRLRGG